jgi:hypothetical protein
MTDIAVNVLVGLVTSLVTAAAVWSWQRVRRARVLRRRAALLGVTPGAPVTIVSTPWWRDERRTATPDLQAVVVLAVAVTELGGRVTVRPAPEVRGVNRDHVELCLGGPYANPRAAAYLAAYLPGVTVRPYDAADPATLAIEVGGREFAWEHDVREHVLVARFVPAGTRYPVLLVAGQTAVTNHAAADFLVRQYRTLQRTVTDPERFCVVLAVHRPDVYGPESAGVVMDASDVAFEPATAATPAP